MAEENSHRHNRVGPRPLDIAEARRKASLYDQQQEARLRDASQPSDCCNAILKNALTLWADDPALEGIFVCEQCGRGYERELNGPGKRLVTLRDGHKVYIGKPYYRPAGLAILTEAELAELAKSADPDKTYMDMREREIKKGLKKWGLRQRKK